MADILIRDVDNETKRLLQEKAKAKGASVNETARELLTQALRPSKRDAWAAAEAFRKRIGPISGDSTADIRADRDNDELYR